MSLLVYRMAGRGRAVDRHRAMTGRELLPVDPLLDHCEEQRNEEHSNGRRYEHAGEDPGTERVPARRAGAASDNERRDAKYECERRHENWAESLTGGLQRRVANGHAGSPQLGRKFHDENRVLRGQSEHRQQSDLKVDVARQTARPDTEIRAEHTEG